MKPDIIARECGVSTATLYRRLSEMGLQLRQFRDVGGNISAEKLKELKDIFSDKTEYIERTQEISLLSQKVSEAENRATAAEAARAEAEARAAAADARTAAAEAEARRLSEQLEDMRRQLEDVRSDRDDWKRAAAESRALQMQQLQRLLPERVSIAQRVRGWFTRKQEEK